MRTSPPRNVRSVAILGGGPSGSYLAASLARSGLRVALFHRDKRPPLVIGESLVPAVIPYLRELGIEEEVASYSMYKPGATFVLAPGDEMSFTFAQIRNAITNYSYNTPRDRFDASVLAAAERAGARIFRRSVRVRAKSGADASAPTLQLDDAAMAEASEWLGGEPDLIVDATGRARTVAAMLDLPTEAGPRRDTALFAHLDGVPVSNPGHVNTDRLERGWCWRIPLPGRTSVGLVVPTEWIQRFGDTIEEQYDNYLRKDSTISSWAAGTKRLTPVVKYTNYQLTTLHGYGPNWALVGDAFGFIDPVFSSGLLVGFDGAKRLARTILRGTPRAWQRYERHVVQHLRAWRSVVDNYYNGRLFTLFKLGNAVQYTPIGGLLNGHFQRHMPRVFTGEATTHRYSRSLLRFMCRWGLAGNDPSKLQVN
jgi:hypothetical protein